MLKLQSKLNINLSKLEKKVVLLNKVILLFNTEFSKKFPEVAPEVTYTYFRLILGIESAKGVINLGNGKFLRKF